MENYPNLHKLRAWMIHLYTGLGLVCGLMALNAVFQRNAQMVFIWLGVALFIDATDGTMARAWKVKMWTPHFDGRKLDDIIDYLNYTFIPAFFAWQFGLLGGVGGLVVVTVVMLTGVYGFCQGEAKTSDGYFTGFPNFWNLLIFYLYFFDLPVEANGLILLVFAALIFVPIKYVSYSTQSYRRLTIAMSGPYGIILLLIVAAANEPDRHLVLASLIFPLYYFVMSLLLNIKSGWLKSGGPKPTGF